jgi:isoleucyl-tRNA synthetase
VARCCGSGRPGLKRAQAIAFHRELEYFVVQTEDGVRYLVGAARLPHLERVLGPVQVLKTYPGAALEGLTYRTLFASPQASSAYLELVPSAHVTADSGTGLVHVAPAHGAEDYALFRAQGYLSGARAMRCHVGPGGVFTPDVQEAVGDRLAPRLVGLEVLGDGSRGVVEILRETDALVKVERYKHRYPYDWKTDKPIIVT